MDDLVKVLTIIWLTIQILEKIKEWLNKKR